MPHVPSDDTFFCKMFWTSLTQYTIHGEFPHSMKVVHARPMPSTSRYRRHWQGTDAITAAASRRGIGNKLLVLRIFTVIDSLIAIFEPPLVDFSFFIKSYRNIPTFLKNCYGCRQLWKEELKLWTHCFTYYNESKSLKWKYFINIHFSVLTLPCPLSIFLRQILAQPKNKKTKLIS